MTCFQLIEYGKGVRMYGIVYGITLDNITSSLRGNVFLLVGLEEQASILQTSCGKELRVISGQQDTETFSLAVCKEQNIANYHPSLEVDLSPGEPQMRTRLANIFLQRIQQSNAWTSNSQTLR